MLFASPDGIDLTFLKDKRFSWDQKIEFLQFLKKYADEEKESLSRQLYEITSYLVDREPLKIRPAEKCESNQIRREAITKLAITSLGVSLSSIPVAIYSKTLLISKEVFPWSVGIGLCSFIGFLFLDNYRKLLSKPKRNIWSSLPSKPRVPEIRIVPASPERTPEREVNVQTGVARSLSFTKTSLDVYKSLFVEISSNVNYEGLSFIETWDRNYESLVLENCRRKRVVSA